MDSIETMQASTMLEMLNSTNLLLEKKLSLIQLLCTGERYNRLCDHNIIIQWVASILPTLSSQEALKVYNCLNVCLKGNKVPPVDGKNFFKRLLSCFMLPTIPEDKQLSSAVRGCLLNILHNPFFQEILKYDISDLSTCVEIYLVTFSFCGVDGRVSELFPAIRFMYKSTLLKSNFVEEFVESMLPNMFTFIGTIGSHAHLIDFCFQYVLFPDTESVSKYLQAFKNYKPDTKTNNQYESLVSLIVRTPFISGSPMLSGKFYEMFCRRFIACCKSNLIMTFELFTFLCSILGCKPNVSIPLPIKANDYNKELSLHCVNSVLVTIQDSSQITHTLNIGRSLFGDYLKALVEFIASQLNETCAEFYEFIRNIFKLIPSSSESIFRKAMSVAVLKHKDANELESYVGMLGEALKMYSKFYNMSKFVTHLFEETVKATAIAKDISDVKWQYLLPWSFLSNQFELTAIQMGTDHICQTIEVVNNLLMDCTAKIEKQECQTEAETCSLVLQFEMLGKIWSRLSENCELPSESYQSRSSVVTSKVFEKIEEAKKLLTLIGKLLLTVSHNSRLMNTFLEMSHLWGHMMYISDRISSAGTDLRDLSLLYNFLDAEEWTQIVKIVAEIDNKICHTKLSDLLLSGLQCFPDASNRAKRDLINNIMSMASVGWLWDNNKYLLESASEKQLAKICEQLASEECFDIPVLIKLQSVDKFCEHRSTRFFFPVYIMKSAGKLLSAGGRELTSSVSSLLTTEFLLTEIKINNVTSESGQEISETMINMISDRIHESVDGQYETQTVAYLEDTFRILQNMSVFSLQRNFRLPLFFVLVALCKDLEKNKLLQNRAFSLMLDVLVGSCTCQNYVQGPCSDCGTFLHLPGDSDYGSILKWLLLESKECDRHSDLIDQLCTTICRDTDLTDRTVESLQSELDLICSFHKVLSKSAVLTADGNVKRKRKKTSHSSNDEIITKCLTYMADSILKFVADENTIPQRNTIVAYSYALQRSIMTSDGKLEILLQRFNSYWELLKICFKESPKVITEDEMVLVSTLLKNRYFINHVLPEEFIQQLWERVQSSLVSMFRSHLVVLCLVETEINEYKWIVETLCNQFKVCEMNEVGNMAMLWSLMVEVQVSVRKLIILGDGLITACCEFTRLSKLITSTNRPILANCKSSIIYFMLTVAKTKQVRITPRMFDEMLEAVNDIKPEESSGIQMGLKLLSALIHFRMALVVDRIPPLLQRFRFLMTTVAATCNVSEKSPTDVWLPYTTSAYQIERVSQTIVKHVEDFARVTPNLICHVISCLEKYTLPSVIKVHYINSVYVFLTICDKHGIEYIKRLMPEPSSEMFKTLYNNYIKYYKFTGNV